jgi:hypothetical protein
MACWQLCTISLLDLRSVATSGQNSQLSSNHTLLFLKSRHYTSVPDALSYVHLKAISTTFTNKHILITRALDSNDFNVTRINSLNYNVVNVSFTGAAQLSRYGDSLSVMRFGVWKTRAFAIFRILLGPTSCTVHCVSGFFKGVSRGGMALIAQTV